MALFAIAIPSEFSIAGYEPGANDTEHGLKLFELWRAKHGKVYRHPAEKARRFENFLKNLEYVRERNAARRGTSSPAGHAVGLNKFADLSNEEFRAMYLSRMPWGREKRVGRKDMVEGREESCEAPYSLDWRKKGAVTAVKDQGECGECFSSLDTISLSWHA